MIILMTFFEKLENFAYTTNTLILEDIITISFYLIEIFHVEAKTVIKSGLLS